MFYQPIKDMPDCLTTMVTADEEETDIIRIAADVSDIIVPDITRTTTHHGRIYQIQNVSDKNVSSTRTVAEDIQNVTRAQTSVITVGLGIHVGHREIAVKDTRIVIKTRMADGAKTSPISETENIERFISRYGAYITIITVFIYKRIYHHHRIYSFATVNKRWPDIRLP